MLLKRFSDHLTNAPGLGYHGVHLLSRTACILGYKTEVLWLPLLKGIKQRYHIELEMQAQRKKRVKLSRLEPYHFYVHILPSRASLPGVSHNGRCTIYLGGEWAVEKLWFIE